MAKLLLIPKTEFDRVVAAISPDNDRLQVLADMCRANALMTVKRAGSGHLGSSFSAMDIVAHLYWKEMNTLSVGLDSADRDIYFSSKGHDVPGLYAALYAMGILTAKKLLSLRRYGGLDGHPDIRIPGIESNSGSLGMGISKGRGMAWGKTALKYGGRVFVLTGDGEWHEGQNFEALQGAAQLHTGNLIVIMDHNKIQSDRPVEQVVSLGDLEAKLRTFGWRVARCDGHDHKQIGATLAAFSKINDRPKILIADTIKGRGVSFMEHPRALKDGGGYYRWHAGAPADEVYERGYREIVERVNAQLARRKIPVLTLTEVRADGTLGANVSLEGEPESGGAAPVSLKSTAEFVADAYGAALIELGAKHSRIVVLDADLAADCRVRQFELKYPERFIECGIAEQDMVSMAGGLARQGLLPVVNSFACFLVSRANEQIYNNASEHSRIIYASHYAGMIPAGPGKSHQSIRDISLLGALPNMAVVQPCNAIETAALLKWAVETAKENVAMRLVIGPSPRRIAYPEKWKLVEGRGTAVATGKDALVLAYGPVMLNEVLVASESLSTAGIRLQVISMPWLNRFDSAWLKKTIAGHRHIFVVEDHAPVGGLGDNLLRHLASDEKRWKHQIHIFGVDGYPACGTPPEALAAQKLDGASLAKRIRQAIRKTARK